MATENSNLRKLNGLTNINHIFPLHFAPVYLA